MRCSLPSICTTPNWTLSIDILNRLYNKLYKFESSILTKMTSIGEYHIHFFWDRLPKQRSSDPRDPQRSIRNRSLIQFFIISRPHSREIRNLLCWRISSLRSETHKIDQGKMMLYIKEREHLSSTKRIAGINLGINLDSFRASDPRARKSVNKPEKKTPDMNSIQPISLNQNVLIDNYQSKKWASDLRASLCSVDQDSTYYQ